PGRALLFSAAWSDCRSRSVAKIGGTSMAKTASNGIRYGTFEAPRSTTERRIRWRNPEIKIPLLMVSPPASRYLLSKEGALSDWFQPEQIFLSYSRTVPPARSGGLRDDTEGHRLGSFG